MPPPNHPLSPTSVVLTLILTVSLCYVSADVPKELDKFLEKLFEFEECEEWVGDSSYVSVATRECSPFTCNFPLEVCSRPAAKYQDKTANLCRAIPFECVTALNGGVPLGTVATTSAPIFTMPPSIFGITPPSNTPPPLVFPGATPSPFLPAPKVSPAPINVRPRDICEMGPPTGRFCGFSQKYVYNKETFECDEFWFPGCRTDETNANLFNTRRESKKQRA
ncbi:unnamed protein product, partial [Mesorhabditis spiculigera]